MLPGHRLFPTCTSFVYTNCEPMSGQQVRTDYRFVHRVVAIVNALSLICSGSIAVVFRGVNLLKKVSTTSGGTLNQGEA